ncbi:MAG: hypothetical protein ACRDND_23785, partial [Streptosporangiaceae bacterium]
PGGRVLAQVGLGTLPFSASAGVASRQRCAHLVPRRSVVPFASPSRPMGGGADRGSGLPVPPGA